MSENAEPGQVNRIMLTEHEEVECLKFDRLQGKAYIKAMWDNVLMWIMLGTIPAMIVVAIVMDMIESMAIKGTIFFALLGACAVWGLILHVRKEKPFWVMLKGINFKMWREGRPPVEDAISQLHIRAYKWSSEKRKWEITIEIKNSTVLTVNQLNKEQKDIAIDYFKKHKASYQRS